MTDITIACAKLCQKAIIRRQDDNSGIAVTKHDSKDGSTTFFLIHHGLKNQLMNDASMQFDLDGSNLHNAAYPLFQQLNLTNLNLSSTKDRVVFTGVDISGTIATYIGKYTAEQYTNKEIWIIDFASPRAGGHHFYHHLEQLQNLHVDHQDWHRSYPPRSLGFPKGHHMIWDQSSFRVHGIDVIRKSTFYHQLLSKKLRYFYQIDQMISQMRRRNICNSS